MTFMRLFMYERPRSKVRTTFFGKTIFIIIDHSSIIKESSSHQTTTTSHLTQMMKIVHSKISFFSQATKTARYRCVRYSNDNHSSKRAKYIIIPYDIGAAAADEPSQSLPQKIICSRE
mmetsp:Transcript_15586/g.19002  ORF Transcript_15586/g.19002 Transcript_15586/m.19002 type:complete len:118 (+) Transcript_15586:287-640(+)